MASAMINEPAPASNPVPFAFESHAIRTVVNGDGIPWFVAKDTASALGIGWSGHTLDNIPEDWRRMVKLTIRQKNDRERSQLFALISEPAVYKLAFRSNKPEADRFTNWVASEVIPALRRTGKYEVCPALSTTITPSQQQELQNIVAAKSSAYPKEALGRIRAQIWSRLHNKFKVAKYDQLPAAAFPEAVEYLVGLAVRAALPEAEPVAELPNHDATVAIPAAVSTDLEAKVRRVRSLQHELQEAAGEVYAVIRSAMTPARPFGSPERSLAVVLGYVNEELSYGLERQINAIEYLARAGSCMKNIQAGA